MSLLPSSSTKRYGNDSLWMLYEDDARIELRSQRSRTTHRKEHPQDRTMPFGKYKGQSLSTLPKGYLRWLYGSTDIDPDLRTAVEVALEERT